MTGLIAGGQKRGLKEAVFFSITCLHTRPDVSVVKGTTNHVVSDPCKNKHLTVHGMLTSSNLCSLKMNAHEQVRTLYCAEVPSIYCWVDATHPWKTCSKHISSNMTNEKTLRAQFSFSITSGQRPSPFPLVKQWGIKLKAFHKRELPAHLLQLVAPEKEQPFFHEQNNMRKQPCCGQEKLFGVALSGFTQQLIMKHSKEAACSFRHVTYSAFLFLTREHISFWCLNFH